MLHPSYSELMTKINAENAGGDPLVKSRYSIVMGTAKRARQLVDKGYFELDDHSEKPLSIAVDELMDGDVRILTPEEDAVLRVEKERRDAEEEEARKAQREARREERRQAQISMAEDDDDDEDDDEDEEAGADVTDEEADAQLEALLSGAVLGLKETAGEPEE